MCAHCVPTPSGELVRFIDNADGTTSVLIDSDKHGTVVSATVYTADLQQRYGGKG